MLYPIQFIIDTIFPPTEHELLLRTVTPERFIYWYNLTAHNTIESISEYHLPEIQAAVAACKFEHSNHAAKLLGILVTHHLKNLPPKKTLLVPIPLSAKRYRKRTFNQVERVLTYLNPLPYPVTICPNLLVRNTDTKPQTSLSRKDRLRNLKGVFGIQKRNLYYLHNIERVIICDDVHTTGATLKAAKAALQPHIPKSTELICLAWAH